MFTLQLMAYLVMYVKTEDMKILFIYGVQAVIFLAVIVLYNVIYPNVSRLVVNNMCMLMNAGMIMITRLSYDNEVPYDNAMKQMVFIALGVTFGLIVPILIKKLKFLADWTYI